MKRSFFVLVLECLDHPPLQTISEYNQDIIFQILVFLHIEMRIWTILSSPMPEPRKRRNNWISNPTEGSLADSIDDFTKVLNRFRVDYKQLFCENVDRLLPVNLI